MKKRLSIFFIILISLVLFLNCIEKERVSDTDFEQAVVYEIFPAILDSIHQDWRLVPPPPPPPSYIDSNGKEVKSDSTRFLISMAKWKKRKGVILKDNALIYLSIQDSVLSFEENDSIELTKHFKNKNIKLASNDLANKYKLDLSKLRANEGNILFKYQSEFPKGREFWKTEYDFYLAASIAITRIQFDTSKTHGVLSAGYNMGLLNGLGVRIFIIKDEKGKWIIDDIVGTWIS